MAYAKINMQAKHLSFFSYNLSKPYPFAWFTPVVIIGGILGTAIFSLINLASSGYELKTQYVNDPNATEATKPWYISWSWDQQLQPKCEPQDVPVGSQVFTSNLGFTYNVESVSKRNPDASYTKLGSLSYLNNVLTDCTVDSIYMDLHKVDLSLNGKGNWWSWDGSSATATAHCIISNPEGPINVSLGMQYRPTAGAYNDVNHTSHASMWWGNNLLSAYWYSSLLALAEQLYGAPGTNFTTTPIWMKGGIGFSPNTTTGDIKKLDFFNRPAFHFVASDGSLENQFTHNVTDLDFDRIYNNPDYLPYSNSLTQALSWAKIMYSALLVDLGPATSTGSVSPNLLTDSELLQYILHHPDDTYRNNPRKAANATHDCGDTSQPPPCYNFYRDINMFAPPNIVFDASNADASNAAKNTSMIESYNAFQPQMGQLGASNATFIAQYPCSVPQSKPIGTIVLSIIVADLVFLQACWVVLKWFAQWLVEKNFEDAMYCPCPRCDVTEGKGSEAGV